MTLRFLIASTWIFLLGHRQYLDLSSPVCLKASSSWIYLCEEEDAPEEKWMSPLQVGYTTAFSKAYQLGKRFCQKPVSFLETPFAASS